MGAVTGKGLSDLIREEYGLRATFLVMSALVVINFSNVITEFIGIATSLDLFHVPKWVSVPVCAVIVWLIVIKGNYKSIEKIFLTASFFYICYIIAGVLAEPKWTEAVKATFMPPPRADFWHKEYVYMLVGIIGTTIAPWMQFYLQASIVEKGVTSRQYKASRLDVIFGCFFTDIVAWFIIIACAATLYATSHGAGVIIDDAAQAARALGPLAGKNASILFGAGLFNASLFAASILPLSTAYTVCEGLGFESGLDKKFDEAKVFYWLYTVLVAAGAAVTLIPGLPLIKVSILSQVLNGMLLPPVLIYMLLLINKRRLMGKYVNSRTFNIIAWTTAGIIMALTVIYVIMSWPKG
jgi:Mn2+/Fe2+ NRAMP family transporter